MWGFTAVFTSRGVSIGHLEKRKFYRQYHCLIPLLAISRKLLSIQIKASNLLLQRLPGEAVVHLKSSKWDSYHLKKSPDLCWNILKCWQGGASEFLPELLIRFVWNSFQTELKKRIELGFLFKCSIIFAVYVHYSGRCKSMACLESHSIEKLGIWLTIW